MLLLQTLLLALYSSGYSNDFSYLQKAAEESITSGSALQKLNELKNSGRNFLEHLNKILKQKEKEVLHLKKYKLKDFESSPTFPTLAIAL